MPIWSESGPLGTVYAQLVKLVEEEMLDDRAFKVDFDPLKTAITATEAAKLAANVHFQSDKDDWETPDLLFQHLNDEFNFDLDAAATRDNSKCDVLITPEMNALTSDWGQGKTIWLNPPYGTALLRWLQKASAAGWYNTVVCLLPSRTDTQWWHDYVMQAAEIRFIRGRVTFKGAPSAAPFPSCIVIFQPGRAIPVFKSVNVPRS